MRRYAVLAAVTAALVVREDVAYAAEAHLVHVVGVVPGRVVLDRLEDDLPRRVERAGQGVPHATSVCEVGRRQRPGELTQTTGGGEIERQCTPERESVVPLVEVLFAAHPSCLSSIVDSTSHALSDLR